MIVEPNVPVLGYILKLIPHSDFKMDTFEDRLRLQKLVYMIEAFDVYLGYGFSWYFRGPYCTNLARAGFELTEIHGEIPDGVKVRLVDPLKQKKLDRCIQFIGSIMDGPTDLVRLEVASSLHLLVITTKMSKQAIFDRVLKKMQGQDVNKDTCQSMWKALCKEGLIPDDRC